MTRLNVLFAASEAVPFSATGGLADVAGALPKALNRDSVDARVVTPLYGQIPREARSKLEFIKSINISLSWRQQYCGIFKTVHEGIVYYLIDNEQYFKRERLYGEHDDIERFAFFSKACLEILQHIDFSPDIIHSNDWHSGLVPVFYRAFYEPLPLYNRIRNVFTIHNIQYQGQTGYESLGDIFGLANPWTELLEYDGCLNLMKGAIEASDFVTTVSPSYAKEIMTPQFGAGLDRLLAQKEHKIRGVLNGIDTIMYDPANDPALSSSYNSQNLEGKSYDKQWLQKAIGLSPESGVPLIGMVSRLTDSKGIGMVREIADTLVADGAQLVVLGTGDKFYEDYLAELQERYPGKVAACLMFKPELARQIYAGSDIFLMPSKTEACGLAQMIAMRYGTIPVVRETGGLRDTVFDVDNPEREGNGFSFASLDSSDLLSAVKRAMDYYQDKDLWSRIVGRAMEMDFNWEASAAEYLDLYRYLLR